MNALDYPTEHFVLPTEISKHLKEVPVQILTHEYRCEAFGSWLFTFRRNGKLHRLVFDGKEYELRLEIESGKSAPISRYLGVDVSDWMELAMLRLETRPSEPTADQVIALVLQASPN